jgi:hypothetical protein
MLASAQTALHDGPMIVAHFVMRKHHHVREFSGFVDSQAGIDQPTVIARKVAGVTSRGNEMGIKKQDNGTT